jgi:hypothetical protein
MVGGRGGGMPPQEALEACVHAVSNAFTCIYVAPTVTDCHFTFEWSCCMLLCVPQPLVHSTLDWLQ